MYMYVCKIKLGIKKITSDPRLNNCWQENMGISLFKPDITLCFLHCHRRLIKKISNRKKKKKKLMKQKFQIN